MSEDLDRAISMLKALPFMSKTIVDDTIYEKVLSFLKLVFSTHNLSTMPVVENVKRACELHDYRVTALAIRILGYYVYYSHDEEAMRQCLPLVTEGITSSEASLRCACLEACRLLFLASPEEHGETLYAAIMLAWLDQSSYVVAEVCKLFVAVLVEKKDKVLVEKLDPSALMLQLLRPHGGDQKQTLSALDLCWELVREQNVIALEYIRGRKLVSQEVRCSESCLMCV